MKRLARHRTTVLVVAAALVDGGAHRLAGPPRPDLCRCARPPEPRRQGRPGAGAGARPPGRLGRGRALAAAFDGRRPTPRHWWWSPPPTGSAARPRGGCSTTRATRGWWSSRPAPSSPGSWASGRSPWGRRRTPRCPPRARRTTVWRAGARGRGVRHRRLLPHPRRRPPRRAAQGARPARRPGRADQRPDPRRRQRGGGPAPARPAQPPGLVRAVARRPGRRATGSPPPACSRAGSSPPCGCCPWSAWRWSPGASDGSGPSRSSRYRWRSKPWRPRATSGGSTAVPATAATRRTRCGRQPRVRLAERLRLPPHDRPRRTHERGGRPLRTPLDEVDALLRPEPPHPPHDRDLADLARRLDDLDREVSHA